MKTKIVSLIILIEVIFLKIGFAQEEPIKNSCCIIGIKVLPEKSTINDFTSNTANNVLSCGIQLISGNNESNFSLETGVYYYQKAASVEVYNGTGISAVKNISAIYYENLGLPFLLRYHYKVVYTSLGAQVDFLLNRTKKNQEYFYTETNQLKDNTLNLGIGFNVGIQIKMNEKINFFTEARLLQTLTPAYSDKRLGYKFLNYGLGLGVNYKI